MGNFMTSKSKWEIDHSYDNFVYSENNCEERDDISRISGGMKPPAYSEDPSLILESAAAKKARHRSHWVAYATMFVMTAGFSVVLSGVWPYLQLLYPKEMTKASIGWVVAANPFGQMIASPILGYLGNRLGSIRLICYFTMSSFIVGNLIYSFLPLMTNWWYHSAYHMMILSRFIVGVSSANVTLCRSYLASSTTVKERTTGIAIISAAQSLGFVIGPAIQTVFSLTINIDTLKYRSTGWFAALLGAINFILLTPWIFQEYNIADKERAVLKNLSATDDTYKLPKADYGGVAGVLYGFFMNQFIYVLLETLMEPFVTDQYAWCDNKAVVIVGIAFACAGVMAIGMFITATRLAKKYDERKILIFLAFVPISIGVFLFLPWGPNDLKYCPPDINATSTLIPSSTFITTSTGPKVFDKLYGNGIYYRESEHDYHPPNLYMINEYSADVKTSNSTDWCPTDEGQCYGCPKEQTWCIGYPQLPLPQFFVAYAIVISGYPYGVSMSNSIYSKMLGPRPQGLWMGILTSSGSLARVTGPIFVAQIYSRVGTRWTFGILFAGMLTAILELSILFKRLIPMKVPKVGDAQNKGKQ